MHIKTIKRTRRGRATREHIKRLGVEKGVARLQIHRTPTHIYAQVLSPTGGKVLAAASSLEKDVRSGTKEEGKIGLSKVVGSLVAKRALKAGVKKVACDRSGFKYHGRIAAVVESARENGLSV